MTVEAARGEVIKWQRAESCLGSGNRTKHKGSLGGANQVFVPGKDFQATRQKQLILAEHNRACKAVCAART
jgi:hypothetical protein